MVKIHRQLKTQVLQFELEPQETTRLLTIQELISLADIKMIMEDDHHQTIDLTNQLRFEGGETGVYLYEGEFTASLYLDYNNSLRNIGKDITFKVSKKVEEVYDLIFDDFNETPEIVATPESQVEEVVQPISQAPVVQAQAQAPEVKSMDRNGRKQLEFGSHPILKYQNELPDGRVILFGDVLLGYDNPNQPQDIPSLVANLHELVKDLDYVEDDIVLSVRAIDVYNEITRLQLVSDKTPMNPPYYDGKDDLIISWSYPNRLPFTNISNVSNPNIVNVLGLRYELSFKPVLIEEEVVEPEPVPEMNAWSALGLEETPKVEPEVQSTKETEQPFTNMWNEVGNSTGNNQVESKPLTFAEELNQSSNQFNPTQTYPVSGNTNSFAIPTGMDMNQTNSQPLATPPQPNLKMGQTPPINFGYQSAPGSTQIYGKPLVSQEEMEQSKNLFENTGKFNPVELTSPSGNHQEDDKAVAGNFTQPEGADSPPRTQTNNKKKQKKTKEKNEEKLSFLERFFQIFKKKSNKGTNKKNLIIGGILYSVLVLGSGVGGYLYYDSGQKSVSEVKTKVEANLKSIKEITSDNNISAEEEVKLDTLVNDNIDILANYKTNNLFAKQTVSKLTKQANEETAKAKEIINNQVNN